VVAILKQSAGILLFRRTLPTLPSFEALLAHSGGPYFRRPDAKGAWSIPKGEFVVGESALDAAKREWTEELGLPVPDGDLWPLGDAAQRSGKVVTVWALEANLDPGTITPGLFDLEWPRGSGRLQQFPEIDRVQWFEPSEAAALMVAGQQVFLDRLAATIIKTAH
jgi:predicted NUDIX family NTP pyrophosphohydrolase